MNKNSNNKSITRRLIALLTIAVFVFVMGFCPVSGFAEETIETEDPGQIESTESVTDENVIDENVTDENVTDESVTDENALDESNYRGTGYREIKEVKDHLTVKKTEQPSYVKKQAKKLRGSLPSSYDSRTKSFYKNRVDVLDQGDTQTCWAHAVCTAAQISYLKELSDSGKTITKDYDLSPLTFAHNFYNRQAYPLYGYTSKDKNVGKNGFIDTGGNDWLSAQAMANWMGMYPKTSYDNTLDVYDPDMIWDFNGWLGTYNDELLLQNAYFIPNSSDYDYDYIMDMERVKEAIMEHGAVSASIFYNDYFLADDGKSFFCDYDLGTNHAVTIIGWDDNYAISNFRPLEPNYKGAWIVQNSYGTDCLDNGYFYVSYDDWNLCDAVAYDMQPTGTYDTNYHYDGNASPMYFKRKANLDIANVYTVPNDGNRHTVKAVGFTTWNDFYAEYNVKVYRKVKSTPTTGKLAADFDVSTDYPGMYTFDFKKQGVSPINLNTGEKYAVVVRATYVDPYDGAFYAGYEKKNSFGWVSFKTTSKKKLCYYRDKKNGKWKDLYKKNKNASFRIKAFTTTEPRIDLGSATVTPPQNNYPHTGKAIKPDPTVRFGGKTLVKGEDYTVSYSANKNPGTATIKITGIGLYKGTATGKFAIGTVTNLRANPEDIGPTSAKISWDKQSKVTGYKVYQYSFDTGKYKLVKTIKKAKTTSYTAKKLVPNTYYEYKVVSYKKIKKKTYTSPGAIINFYTTVE